MTPKVEIISIGDEILYGQTLNTNAHWMGDQLDKIGVRISRMLTIADKEDVILKAFEEAEKRADIVLITGGLGPTEDDLTKSCLAKYFNCELKMNEEALQEIKEQFEKAGRQLNESNKKQALLPDCCDKISNNRGTAPGMWFNRDKKVFVSMPGVPGEMKKMMTDYVIPRLQKEFKTEIIYHKLIKTVGIAESTLSEKVEPWARQLPEHIKLAYLPSLGQVKLRLTASGDDREKLKKDVEQEIDKLKEYISKYIYGYDNNEIESVVGEILKKQKKTFALAESCTGGYISHLVSGVPGCSEYYRGSIVPYHNDLKEKVLGVKHKTLTDHGAVSEQTVIEMANKVREMFGADIGLASSGIAGPSGGTEDKPVGTVWIACADGEHTKTKKLQLFKDRMMNIEATGVAALNLVRLTLLQTVEINS
ncbi:MAG: competence/damage-inducible protein A [Candidatus Cyclobacteriaceae bacterium M2_1C_046]